MGKLHYQPYASQGEARITYGLQTIELAEEGRVIQKFGSSGQTKQYYHDYLHEVG